MKPCVRPAVGLVALAALLLPIPARPGVKYGDAVPGIIRPSDLETIKRTLHLDRFSIVAAVWLGAEAGREAIIAEPLSDETLKRLKSSCDSGGTCPDPLGFIASRVRIVLLRDGGVETIIVVQKDARGAHGRLADLREMGVEGDVLGWSGRADASEGHVALSLIPLTGTEEGGVAAGLDPPLLIRFNPKRDRFQVYDCVSGDDARAICGFRDERGD